MGILTRSICLIVATLPQLLAAADAQRKDYPFAPVRLTDVRVTDAFWSKRMEINRTATIPFAFRKCEETGRIDNFAIAGGLKKGERRAKSREPVRGSQVVPLERESGIQR